MTLGEAVGHVVYHTRSRAGLSAYELATRLKVQPHVIDQIERMGKVSLNMVIALALEFGIRPWELLRDADIERARIARSARRASLHGDEPARPLPFPPRRRPRRDPDGNAAA